MATIPWGITSLKNVLGLNCKTIITLAWILLNKELEEGPAQPALGLGSFMCGLVLPLAQRVVVQRIVRIKRSKFSSLSTSNTQP